MVISTIPIKTSRPAPSTSQLFQEMDRHRRPSCWQWLGCLCLLLVIVLLGGLLWLVASSGIVTIPGVSQLAYPKAPSPARVVVPMPFDQSTMINGTHQLNPDGSSIESVTEGQLSSLLSADHFPLFRQAQVTIDPDGFRLYALYVGQPFYRPIPVQVHVVPATAMSTSCTVDQIQIGLLPIPASFIKSIVDRTCQKLSEIVTLSPPGQLNDVTLKKGELQLTVQPPAIPTGVQSTP